MKFFFKGVLCVLVVISSVNLHAENFSYTYIETGNLSIKTDVAFGGSRDSDAKFWAASLNVSKHVNLIFLDEQADQGLIDVTGLGFGVHGSASDSTDLFANLLYFEAERDVWFSRNETGLSIEFGIRHNLGEYFEVGVFAANTSVFGDREQSLGLEGRLKLGKVFSLGASISEASNTTGIGFSLRAEY